MKNLYRIAWVMLLPMLTGSDCEKTTDEHLIEQSYIHEHPQQVTSKKTAVYISTRYNQGEADIYQNMLQGYLLLGSASFTSYPVTHHACIKFGKKVGADAVLVSLSNKKEVIKYKQIAVPDKEINTVTQEQESNDILGSIGSIFIDKLLDRRRQHVTITPKNRTHSQVIYKFIEQPYREIHYTHTLRFLKKSKAHKAPWEYTLKDFIGQQKHQQDGYIGDWVHYQIGKLTLLATNSEYIAFISRDKKYKNKEKCKINKKLKWRNGDIKLRINQNNKQGFYLDSDKMPIPVYILLNQSNQLEIRETQTDSVITTLHKKP